MASADPQTSVINATKITISTGARLHFGLLDTAPPFGGIGVMIQQPQTRILVENSQQFDARGSGAERAFDVAKRFQEHFALAELPSCSIQILERPEPHSGLGTGTQLNMAVAEAITLVVGKQADSGTVHRLADRGKRSAVGVHGYANGGLIFELPAENSSTLNPIQERIEIDDGWRIVLFRPRSIARELVCDENELNHFSAVRAGSGQKKDQLQALITEHIIPAAQTRNFDQFARSVEQYNHASGMMFASVQGGAYNGPEVTNLVDQLKHLGARGVGQSSWGPSVFAWFESAESAREFIPKIDSERVSVMITKPLNRPREIAAIS